MLPEGIIPPVLTPLTKEQEFDKEAYKKLLDKLIENGVHALFVGGTAGLGSILTDAMYMEVVETALSHVAGRLPVLVGVLDSSTMQCVEKLRKLEKLGAETAVVVAPYYCRAQNDDQLLRHFEVLKKASNLKLVLYNIPGCTGCVIPIDLICKMNDQNWIIGCKDSSGDPAYFSELCRRTQDSDLKVYQGMQPDFARLAELNAAGCVPVPGNVYPEIFVKAWNHRLDQRELPEIQKECDKVWNQLVVGCDYFSRAVKMLATLEIGDGTMPEPF